MTKAEIITKIEALNEWEELMEQAKAEAEAIRDSIKEEMLERETEELIIIPTKKTKKNIKDNIVLFKFFIPCQSTEKKDFRFYFFYHNTP